MTELIKKGKQNLLILTNHPLYKKYSLIIIPIICSITALLIILLITVPQVYKIIEKNTELEKIKQKTIAYQAKSATLDKIGLEYYKSGLNKALLTLPNEKDIPSAIDSVLQLISVSGLQMTNLSLGAAAAGPNGSESFGVNIEVAGNLDQIKTLIIAANNASRLIKIAGISLTNSSSTTIQASIDLLVFYAPLDLNTKTALDQQITPLSEEEINLLSKIEQNLPINSLSNDLTPIDGPTGKPDPFN